MELTGRTQFGKPLVCRMKKVISKRFLHGPNIELVQTDEGEFRLGSGIKLDDIEVDKVYFFQTINMEFRRFPIRIVDFIKT